MLLQQCEVKLLIYSKILFAFFCSESYILKGVVGVHYLYRSSPCSLLSESLFDSEDFSDETAVL
jgi:hypothetical protein